MGQGESREPRQVPIEELSHELALRFASKCYTHLEIAHFKDNFKALADHQDDIEYWKEETLCQFLALPEDIRAGPVLYQMSTYLGAFPFPSLAPAIMTREAMLKVVTLMTNKYRKVLKRGKQDKVKLLFKSLAIFDRGSSFVEAEKPQLADNGEVNPEGTLPDEKPPHRGYTIDEAVDDDEEEDDDDLVLAALDSLDAIEIFKQDQKVDRKIQHSVLPADHVRRLVMLSLYYAGVKPLDSLVSYSEGLDQRLKQLESSASAVVAAFDPYPASHGIGYRNFVYTMTTTFPDLFEPLASLFEHFLYSKSIDLSRHRDSPMRSTYAETTRTSPIYVASGDTSSYFFNDTLLSQISLSVQVTTPSGSLSNIHQSGCRFNQLFSTTTHGTSMSSFGRQVQSWHSSTLLIISGTMTDSQTTITLGAYLPEKWKEPTSSTTSPDPSAPKATLFQLSPRHAIFPATIHNTSSPISYYSTQAGMALGCVIPPRSRTQTTQPILGPVSILINADISTGTFQHDLDGGTGAFTPDPQLAQAQKSKILGTQPRKVEFDIEALEVWGISFPDGEGEDEVSKQKKRLAWEEAEAARRRGVNFGGDKEGARALLEMAGLVGDHAGGGRSGGSV